mmetsp:Transcript_137014/g.382008  ORF Transcript_137014/g.382008 Transcript_137014/m.382008 type:complete len:324 (+) Transcript_137014:424-1395(+)
MWLGSWQTHDWPALSNLARQVCTFAARRWWWIDQWPCHPPAFASEVRIATNGRCADCTHCPQRAKRRSGALARHCALECLWLCWSRLECGLPSYRCAWGPNGAAWTCGGPSNSPTRQTLQRPRVRCAATACSQRSRRRARWSWLLCWIETGWGTDWAKGSRAACAHCPSSRQMRRPRLHCGEPGRRSAQGARTERGSATCAQRHPRQGYSRRRPRRRQAKRSRGSSRQRRVRRRGPLPQDVGALVPHQLLTLGYLLHRPGADYHGCWLTPALLVYLDLATHLCRHRLDVLPPAANESPHVHVVHPQLLHLLPSSEHLIRKRRT